MTTTQPTPDLNEIVDLLKRIVAEELSTPVAISEIDEDASLEDDLRLDSVAMLELVTALEERFSFRFRDTDLRMSSFRSLRVLAHVVADRLADKDRLSSD